MDKLGWRITELMSKRYFCYTRFYTRGVPMGNMLDEITAEINLLESILEWT